MSPAFVTPHVLPLRGSTVHFATPLPSRSTAQNVPPIAPRVAHQPSASLRHRASQAVKWAKLATITAGSLCGVFLPGLSKPHRLLSPPAATAAAPSKVMSADGGIPLGALGIKRDDFMSERELRRRKTTQYSEAEEEIMEMEEYEVETQWFRDLQTVWAGIASVGGIFVLYKGGVMWENWIKEQERKDMEEEIELTGTFIDPRAVRKDEDDESDTGKGKGKPSGKDPKSDDGGSTEGPSGDEGYSPDGGLESLEKLFGQS